MLTNKHRRCQADTSTVFNHNKKPKKTKWLNIKWTTAYKCTHAENHSQRAAHKQCSLCPPMTLSPSSFSFLDFYLSFRIPYTILKITPSLCSLVLKCLSSYSCFFCDQKTETNITFWVSSQVMLWWNLRYDFWLINSTIHLLSQIRLRAWNYPILTWEIQCITSLSMKLFSTSTLKIITPKN